MSTHITNNFYGNIGQHVDHIDHQILHMDKDGNIQIQQTTLSEGQLLAVLKKAVVASGQSTPVVIRGDYQAKHEQIKRVMDIAGRAGLWKLRFAALKEKA